MYFLFRSCKIIDSNSPHHQERLDIRIQDGIITEIGKKLSPSDATIFNIEDLSVTPSFIDLESEAGDPGLEQREDLQSLAQAALAGGYARIGLRPHAQPVVHDKSGVSYLQQQSFSLPISILPIGALSKDNKGVDITEMLDMQKVGAVAFSDGTNSVQHAGLLQRALLYVKTFNGLVMNQALDKSIAGKGQLHEGVTSTSLGMKGIPALAEEIMIERDLRLLEYTNSRLHISHVSTARGVESIRQAKKRGLNVTASVAVLNLLHTVESLNDFNSHFKVLPPLREQTDKEALIEGLKDDTIDCISSNHCPRELEEKELEFAYADFGATMLSTTFAAARTALDNYLTEEELIKLFTYNPAEIFGQTVDSIKKGSKASLTFYQFNKKWMPRVKDIRSKSKNAPLIGQQLTGKIVGMVNKGQVFGFKS